ncbi:MAG TPA: NAD-dependent epimerase/dehydratase family protein [Alphaproteobacteria bacterium]|nr:NAD-dependent epimerase/dehydratase family protein [Alphaproteobacteria bacterium]
MKIAITGGSGFIGTRLIQELRADGHEIVIIDIAHDQPIDILYQDKLNAACAGCEVIYHLAAAHRDDVFPRSIYYDTNGQGTQNVVQAAEINNVKHIIFTSTVAVYGLNVGSPDESAPVNPFNDYGKSKLEAEEHLKKWAEKNQDHKATIIRPVVVFGENNRGNVHTLINQISRGKFLMIGNGENKKSMAYVGNVAAFLKYCLKARNGVEIFNYADKPDFTTNELTDVIYEGLHLQKPKFSLPYSIGMGAGYAFDVLAKITGKTLPISSIRVQKFCADTTVNADKVRSDGFVAQYSLAEGVGRMIDHDFADVIKNAKQAA